MKDRPRTPSLRGQIFFRTLVVSLIPLVLLTSVGVLGLRNLTRTAEEGVDDARLSLISQTVTARLQADAEAAGREIDLILAERINDVVTWSRQPTVIDGSEAGAHLAVANELIGLDAAAVEERFAGSPSLNAAPLADAFLAAEMARRDDFVDISYTDRNGYNAGVVGTPQDFVQSDEAWWQSAWDNGIYVGGVTLHPESGQYVIPVSSRIENDQGTRVGVLRASLSIGFVQAVADLRSADGVDLTVVTAGRQLLAETTTGHDPSRIGTVGLGDSELSPGVRRAFQAGEGTLVGTDVVYGFTRVASTRGAVARDDEVDRFDWFVVTGQPNEAAFAPLESLDGVNEDLHSAGRELSLVAFFVLVVSCLAAAVAASILSRKIVTPIKLLTEGARRATETALPEAVARAQHAANDDDPIEPMAVEIHTASELDELASSFNSVQRTAIELATGQARHRRTTAEMFANLGRRNQSLVKRQLRFIEELERSEEDAERLASLFRLDHLATRMRRNAESLLVIAGHRSQGRRSAPVRVELVTQAALGEVENFERVDTAGIEPAALLGRTVTDIAHILAELIENALSFSPPETPVIVTGRTGASHYTISIVDRGIGLSPDELAAVNERLSITTDLDLTPTKQLGLLVVSKLSARHAIAVRLALSPTDGVVVTVEIPNALVVAPDAAPALPSLAPAQPAAVDPSPAASASTWLAGASPGLPPKIKPESPPAAADRPMPPMPPSSPAPAPAPAPAAAPAPAPKPDPASLPPAADLPLQARPPRPSPTPVSAATDGPPAEADRPPDRRRDDISASVVDSVFRTSDPRPIRRDDPSPKADEQRYVGSLSSTSAAQISTVSRRASKRPAMASSAPADPTQREKRAVATTDSAEEVVQEAEQLRDRWSSFRRGRNDATPEPHEASKP